jgi:para-aminobenzoate synthetase component 1
MVLRKMLRQFIRPVNLPPPVQCAAALRDAPHLIWFDSADAKHQGNRFSYLAYAPQQILSLSGNAIGDDPFGKAQKLWQDWAAKVVPADSPVPFTGGLAGLFSYDLGRAYEDLPLPDKPSCGLPALAVGIYTTVIAFDRDLAYLCVTAESADEADLIEMELLAKLGQAKRCPKLQHISLTPAEPRAQTEAHIRKAIDYIVAGDMFQANITAAFKGDAPDGFDLLAAYMALREHNPGPYGAFMRGDDWGLASCSPEQFLKVQGGKVTTRPIKGTAPIGEDPAILANCPKNRAENVMIVDLMRNDLSKVCEPDSIDVPSLCALETFRGLRHLVSTVTGQLANGQTAFDVLRACFPGGSITGAPKLRAMQIIDELEATNRGAYCGSLAYIDWQGGMDSSILIRTLLQAQDKLTLNAGGGVTARSNPQDEYDELRLKAAKITNTLCKAAQSQTEGQAA